MKLFAIAAAAALIATPALAERLHLVEHADTDATAHVGTGQDNPGDVLTFANTVFDRANKRQIGTDNGFCIRTVPGKAYECTFSISLGGGQIMVQGPFYDTADSVLAVTGGTGRYAGVRGEMRLHSRDAKGSAYDFIFTLTR
jgi:hypothetical protein